MNFNGEIASESVSRGHPDKLADQISDAVLDACLKRDARAKVACETMVKDNTVVLGGEVHGRGINTKELGLRDLVADVLVQVGYDAATFGSVDKALAYAGLAAESFELIDLLGEQSQNIRDGVDQTDSSIGAGDQGFVYGYACNDTPELMPAPIHYCQRMMRAYHQLLAKRRGNGGSWMRPDAKCQLVFRYRDGRPVSISSVTFSAQHAPFDDGQTPAADAKLDKDSPSAAMQADIVESIIRPTLPAELLSDELKTDLDRLDLDPRRDPRCLFINPTRSFVTGGPKGDAGLTGRKIIVDTYGGLAHHGGGAFSGKDATKVDRSAAYMARCIAKALVAADLCERCEVMIGYVIGYADPVAVHVNPGGECRASAEELSALVRKEVKLSPKDIIDHLDLDRPIFSSTAAHGHFGQGLEEDHSWENTELAARFADLARAS